MESVYSLEKKRFATLSNYPGYRVGADGSVWTRRRTHGFADTWRQMKATPSTGGYLKVQLVGDDGNQRNLYVHRLVLSAFVGPCPNGCECCHANGVRSDNRLANLSWDTRKENHRQRVDHGNGLTGSTNGMAVLNEQAVVAIRQLHSRGVATKRRLAEWFGVSESSVGRVVNRNSWSHI